MPRNRRRVGRPPRNRATKELIWQAVQQCRPGQKAATKLRYAEVAAAFGVSPRTVRQICNEMDRHNRAVIEIILAAISSDS
jgi:DNA invertase Pin-like site-specific DNA recombinase